VLEVEKKAPELFERIAAGEMTAGAALRQVKTAEKKEALEVACAQAQADGVEVDVRQCSMADLLGVLSETREVDAIITDPPYGREYLPLYGELARLAKAAMKESGLLAVMVGHSYLPEVFGLMTPHIPYLWTMAYLTPGGQAVQLWARKVITFWKPVLLFGAPRGWIGDVLRSDVNDNDKRFHDWGQSESGMADLIERLTRPGELVVDPFAGAGTTGVACVARARRFIGCDTDPASVHTARMRVSAACQK
jgi:site-specific DNA-methyltransferase (adenine-specific)